MKSIMRALCVGFVALGIVGVAGVAASASPAAGTVYDTRTLYLTDTPNRSDVACTSQEIHLAANTYSWQFFFMIPAGQGRSIDLTEGNYFWLDCIAGQSDSRYLLTSTLISSHGVAEITSGELHVLTPGDYTFGSQLSS